MEHRYAIFLARVGFALGGAMSRDAHRNLSRREGPKFARTMRTAAAVLLSTAAAQTFEVASVKPSKSNDPPYSNFPLGPGDVYVPNGGLFSAKNFPLVTYIFFAYKIIGNQGQYLLPQLPDWTKREQFDIQARALGCGRNGRSGSNRGHQNADHRR
jgi:hypothetical protein